MSFERLCKTAVQFSLIACTAIACKPSNDYAKGSPDLPVRRAGGGDATASKKIGTLNAGDKLIVDLERLPPAGSAALWACFDLPPADFALGRALCANDDSKSFEITAAHVRFVCTGHPDYGTVEPRNPPQLDACPSYDVMVYAFEPALAFSISR